MKTHITFVLDSSGSMSKIKDDTVGGFNAFLDDQRDESGTATVTLFEFNTNIDLIYRDRLIADAPLLDEATYTPGGKTALHDALITAIKETRTQIVEQPDERPDSVIVVVLTDGKENASETPQDEVRDQVKYQREEAGWEFLFIGANQNAALTATEIGMDADRSLDMEHSSEGTRAAYDSTSERISQARREGNTGGFNKKDRERQGDSS